MSEITILGRTAEGEVRMYNSGDTVIGQFPTGCVKGDIMVHNGSGWTHLAVGSNGQAIVADSAQTEGLKWGTVEGGTGVTDHGQLTGLADDDHAQYHNDARGDARYFPLPASPAKGDILVYNGSAWVKLNVGTNGYVLTADSAQATGTKWAAASGGSGTVLDVTHNILAAAVTWTNMPAAATEFTGLYRIKVDLTTATQFRTLVRVTTAGVAGSYLYFQYSTNESTWVTLGSNIPISPAGTLVSAWSDVPAGAKADVFIRVVGQAGNATADPQFRGLALQVR